MASIQAPAEFKVGASLLLNASQGGPTQRFEVVSVEAGRCFTLLQRLPFASLKIHHRVEACELGCRLHLRMELEGFLGWFFRLTRGKAWKAAVPPLLRALAKAAQKD